jgi:hypothetical protein
MIRNFSQLPSREIIEKFLYFYGPYSPRANMQKFMTYDDSDTEKNMKVIDPTDDTQPREIPTTNGGTIKLYPVPKTQKELDEEAAETAKSSLLRSPTVRPKREYSSELKKALDNTETWKSITDLLVDKDQLANFKFMLYQLKANSGMKKKLNKSKKTSSKK